MVPTLGRDPLSIVGGFIEDPFDIIRSRSASLMFRNVVCESACKAFFFRHSNTITRMGFYPLPTSHYENFKRLFQMIAHQFNVKVITADKLIPLLEKQSRLNNANLRNFADLLLPQQWEEYLRKLVPEDFWDWLSHRPQVIEKIRSIHHFREGTAITFLPSAIVLLTSLEMFLLNGHRLKQLPDYVSLLTSLKFLSLHNNCIKYVNCPFHKMPQLRCVDLSGNLLTELPSPELFSRTQQLCLSVDPVVALSSSDKLDQYPGLFLHFDVTHCEDLEKLGRIIEHNITVFSNLTAGMGLLFGEYGNHQSTLYLNEWRNAALSHTFLSDLKALGERFLVAKMFFMN